MCSSKRYVGWMNRMLLFEGPSARVRRYETLPSILNSPQGLQFDAGGVALCLGSAVGEWQLS